MRWMCKSPVFKILIFSFFLFTNTVSADTIGQRETFFVNDEFDRLGRKSLPATLKHISDKAYYYVDDSHWGSLGFIQQNNFTQNLQKFAEEFDNVIYPDETGFFGSEANPGIDGDPKITVLFQDLKKNNGGYFDSGNGYSREQISTSNQREMISLNAEVLANDPDFAKNFMAHEFQHLISFNRKELSLKSSEDVWLNEVRAQYAISHVGYNNTFAGSDLERRMSAFLQTPSDSLTEWPNSTVDYGIATVFGEYLAEQYGPPILSETLGYNTTGLDSINHYLQEKGRPERFENVFAGWMGAVYLNDISKDSRLGYQRQELKNIHIPPYQGIMLSPNYIRHTFVVTIKDWQPVWHEYNLNPLSTDMSKSLKLEIFGDPIENFVVSYLAYYNSGAVKFGKVNMVSGTGVANILNSAGGLNRVVVLSTKGTKRTGFKPSEPASLMSIVGTVVDTKDVAGSAVKDGDLIRKRGEKELYVIWGKYKRYLNLDVVGLYGHLNPANAIEFEPEAFHRYTTANYVKYENDEKVYAVWPDGTKHWLNITPQQWDASGRDWNAIFVINDLELNHYRIGVEITR